MSDIQAMAAMPRYQCHKKVWALKIAAIELKRPTIEELDKLLANEEAPSAIGAVITPAESGYAPFEVTQDFMHKHHPRVGGFYVVYEDGYKSYSPAKAFEDGYTKIQ